MLDILEWEWACRIERHIKTGVIKEQSWWKTKCYWQGFVLPESPMCPHWCPCLVSSRLSYPTGFTKLKRDWLFCGNFYASPSQQIDFAGFRSGGLMFILLLIITVLAFYLTHWWAGLQCAIILLGAKVNVWLWLHVLNITHVHTLHIQWF